ncbi:hypothetical protein CFOL_v3_09898 [Cephalotus follicularis]|uniref:Uncharacterized protein n=1 Tax=Cephalotus follicularis TaxID=3775 RepID=A0A1Q3BEL6_CEPFO|nr:hypothetical protein CFOL_v3_09898 [Cephalotus follicularis]
MTAQLYTNTPTCSFTPRTFQSKVPFLNPDFGHQEFSTIPSPSGPFCPPTTRSSSPNALKARPQPFDESTLTGSLPITCQVFFSLSYFLTMLVRYSSAYS